MYFIGMIMGAQVLLVTPYVMSQACPGDIGCYSPKTQTILLDDTLKGDRMKFALYHEIGHAYLHTADETAANNFAYSMMKL